MRDPEAIYLEYGRVGNPGTARNSTRQHPTLASYAVRTPLVSTRVLIGRAQSEGVSVWPNLESDAATVDPGILKEDPS